MRARVLYWDVVSNVRLACGKTRKASTGKDSRTCGIERPGVCPWNSWVDGHVRVDGEARIGQLDGVKDEGRGVAMYI
jgi:hypothetical protein